MNEIITIASIVQAEAGSNDQMKTIAAVIENRLQDTTNYPSLGCQSTTDYINNKVAPALSSTSAHTADYYLTYYSTASTSTVKGFAIPARLQSKLCFIPKIMMIISSSMIITANYTQQKPIRSLSRKFKNMRLISAIDD